MNAADLQKLLDEATPGELQLNRVSHLSVETETGRGVASCGGYYDNTSDGRYAEENAANARLFVMTKHLARRVIAAERVITAAKTILDGYGFCSDGNDAYREVQTDHITELDMAVLNWDATQ